MFKMSSAGCYAGCQSLAPFTDRVVNHLLVQTVPFLLDTVAQLFHVRDPVVVVHTLVGSPHRVVDGVQIRLFGDHVAYRIRSASPARPTATALPE